MSPFAIRVAGLALTASILTLAVGGTAHADFAPSFPLSPGDALHSGDDAIQVEASSGPFVVAWARFEDAATATGTELRARTVDADGSMGPVQTVASTPGSGAADWDFDVASDGDSFFAWQDASGTVKTRRMSAEGVLGSTQNLYSTVEGRELAASVDGDGDALVTFEDLQFGTQYIRARTVSRTGTLGPLETVAQDSSLRGPAVALDVSDDGGAVFAYEDYSAGVFAVVPFIRQRSPSGTYSAPEPLASYGRGPSVSRAENGTILAAWQDYDVEEAHAATFQGSDRRTEVNLTSPGAESAGTGPIALNDDGGGIVMYSTVERPFGFPEHHVLGRRVEPSGAWGSAFEFQTGLDGGVPEAIAMDTVKNAIALWNTWDPNFELRAGIVTADGQLGPMQRSLGPGFTTNADVAVDLNGNALAAWLGDDGSRFEARAALAAKDVTPPETTIGGVAPASPFQYEAVELSFATDETASFECSIDGSPFEPCESPKAYPTGFGPGTHVFEVRATDFSLNEERTPARLEFVVTGPPAEPPLPPGEEEEFDSDGDGILDGDDACPDQFANTADGCPLKTSSQRGVGISCGKARFDWYSNSGDRGFVRKGDQACYILLSNAVSAEALDATLTTPGGSLTKTFGKLIGKGFELLVKDSKSYEKELKKRFVKAGIKGSFNGWEAAIKTMFKIPYKSAWDFIEKGLEISAKTTNSLAVIDAVRDRHGCFGLLVEVERKQLRLDWVVKFARDHVVDPAGDWVLWHGAAFDRYETAFQDDYIPYAVGLRCGDRGTVEKHGNGGIVFRDSLVRIQD